MKDILIKKETHGIRIECDGKYAVGLDHGEALLVLINLMGVSSLAGMQWLKTPEQHQKEAEWLEKMRTQRFRGKEGE